MYVVPGADLIQSPQQVRQLQNALNAIAGDIGWKQKVVVLPPGSEMKPIKPNTLADQFDELIISQVTMAIGLTPTDLGIAPKVSAVQSPAASNQMAKMQSGNSVDRWLMPETEALAQFHNFIIRKVLKQDDMTFVFSGLEQPEDESQKANDAINKTKASLISIDEGRKEIGYDALGLPETSVPLIFTATGATPVETAVQSAQLSFDQQKNPPMPPPQIGPDGNPVPQPPAGPGGAPAATQAPQGKPAAKPVQSSPDTGRVDDKGEPTSPAAEAASNVQATKPKPPGSAKAQLAEVQVLCRQLDRGKSFEEFEPRAMSSFVFKAFRDAYAKYGEYGAVSSAKSAIATEHDLYLADLAVAMTEGTIEPTVFSFEAGRVAAEGVWKLRHAEDDNVFPTAKDVEKYLAKTYPEKDLGWVKGCTWKMAIVPLTKIDSTPPSGGIDEKTIDRQVQAFKDDPTSVHPVVLVLPPGGELYEIADGHHRVSAAFTANLDSIEAWVGVPSDSSYQSALVAMQADRMNGGTDVATKALVIADGQLQLPPIPLPSAISLEPGDTIKVEWAEDVKYSPEQPRDERGRFGSGDGMSNTASEALAQGIEHDGGGTVDPHTGAAPTTGFQVARQGATVQLDASIADGQHHAELKMALRAYADQHAEALKGAKLGAWVEGGKVWLEPSETVASKDEAIALGQARDQIAVWDNEHGEEIPTGGSGGLGKGASGVPGQLVGDDRRGEGRLGGPGGNGRRVARKSGVVAAGLAVRAADTGRVLMIRRSSDGTDDPAAGTWEFPGGHVESSETPLEAALREFAEETGTPAPTGVHGGTWDSTDGVYRGHVLEVANEFPVNGERQVMNPDDPDGDYPDEAHWVDPDSLHTVSALRSEVKDNLPQTLAALGVQKFYDVRDDHGRFTSGGGGDASTSPELKALAVMHGGTATISPSEADAVMHTLATSPEPVELMGHLQVQGQPNLYGNSLMGIPRDQMPVIPADTAGISKFSSLLESHGITASLSTADPRSLQATQGQLDGRKIGQIYQAIKDGKIPNDAYLVISREGAILDGHHRWAAWAAEAMTSPQPVEVPVLKVDASMADLLNYGHEFDAQEGIATNAFGAKVQKAGEMGNLRFGETPTEACPDPSKPYLWIGGKWILIATDAADDAGPQTPRP